MKIYTLLLIILSHSFLNGSSILEDLEENDRFCPQIARIITACHDHSDTMISIKKFYDAIMLQDYKTLSRIMKKKTDPDNPEFYTQAKQQYAQSYISAHVYQDHEMIKSLHLGIENGWSPIPNVNILNMIVWTFHQKNGNMIEHFSWDKVFLNYLTQLFANADKIDESVVQLVLFKLLQLKNIEYIEIFTKKFPHFPSSHSIGIALQKASEDGYGEAVECFLCKIFRHKDTPSYVNKALNKAASNNHGHMIPYFLIYLEQYPEQGKNILLHSLKMAVGKKNKSFVQKIFETKYRPQGKDISDLLKIKTNPEIKYILRSNLLFLGGFRNYFGF